jgi:hypothetical protein
MTSPAEPTPPPPDAVTDSEPATDLGAARRRIRISLVVIGAVVVLLLTGGGIAWRELDAHYRGAPSLVCSCGLVWASGEHTRNSEAVGHFQYSALARPGARQAFYVDFYNPSSVTQTILGLTDGELTGWRPRLAVSAQDVLHSPLSYDQLSYRAGPVAIPPHAERVLRYSVLEAQCMEKGSVQFWTATVVRVRVGAYTRVEAIDFGGNGMAIVGTRAQC